MRHYYCFMCEVKWEGSLTGASPCPLCGKFSWESFNSKYPTLEDKGRYHEATVLEGFQGPESFREVEYLSKEVADND